MPIKTLVRTAVLAAILTAGFAGTAAAQSSDSRLADTNIREAVASMQAKNYVQAERQFIDVLKIHPNEPRGNFMLGVIYMIQNKWSDAKKYLEVAVQVSPREPDPKGRLGVTLVKLGDNDGAMKQRAELQKMGAACAGKCPNAQFISDDLAMIDAAMASAPKTTP